MDSTCVQSSCPHIVLGCERLECVSVDLLMVWPIDCRACVTCPHIVLGSERLECVSVDVLILSDPMTVECVLHVLTLLGSRCCTLLAVSIESGIMSLDPPVNYVHWNKYDHLFINKPGFTVQIMSDTVLLCFVAESKCSGPDSTFCRPRTVWEL